MKLGEKVAFCLPTAGRRTQFFHPKFTQPGKSLLVQPCTWSFKTYKLWRFFYCQLKLSWASFGPYLHGKRQKNEIIYRTSHAVLTVLSRHPSVPSAPMSVLVSKTVLVAGVTVLGATLVVSWHPCQQMLQYPSSWRTQTCEKWEAKQFEYRITVLHIERIFKNQALGTFWYALCMV